MKNWFKLSLPVLCLLSFSAQAVKLSEGDYRYREDVEAFIESVAKKSDYTEQQLVKLFSQAKQQTHLFERMNKPAEKKLEWHQYRKIFLTNKRINKGIKFWEKNRKLLEQVEQKYKVPAEIIVAIVGVETFYGVYKGKSPVFDTLVTFAFDYPKRAKFFTKELEEFLILSSKQNFKVREVKGSYAGAMGMPQFISSSYRHYSVDFDGDGKADLFDSLPDILGSVANYFKSHGWKPGEAVTYPLSLAKNNKVENLKVSVKPSQSWKTFKASGLRAKSSIADETPVALIKLQQKKSADYWAGLKNFYVITRYNHSEMYAMAVYQLSQKIKSGMKL
ncbi:MAG: lytic murein transglycosylase B [Gammaproteobacteria bacterium]|jgi:membrane-bound lytic murein transglycosylase B|nr:lytic murein transglycosylase B [Gammaproteobacteria bacterium]MBT3722922.1 lytic murein transglycosylase B [Gammaproteobacteria bacterium]MBT4075265.1 lytic murein transglycosylase B [Gammaproteobacteria bacterium]MBT4193420.1 lytic murein transglycosylase B [Gammaproteobacteria bacterium]MBT4449039.1 lytic murein transglycosylase B [Gammaproteobacteria bacterium]